MKLQRIAAGLLLACFLMSVSAITSEARSKQVKDHSLKIEQSAFDAHQSFDYLTVAVLPQTVVLEPQSVVTVYPDHLVSFDSKNESAHVASTLRCRGPTGINI